MLGHNKLFIIVLLLTSVIPPGINSSFVLVTNGTFYGEWKHGTVGFQISKIPALTFGNNWPLRMVLLVS